MPEYVVDSKGKKHKLLSKKVDFHALTYSFALDELITILQGFVSDELHQRLLEIAREVDNEIGTLKCDEYISVVAVQYGYNFGDCENEQKSNA